MEPKQEVKWYLSWMEVSNWFWWIFQSWMEMSNLFDGCSEPFSISRLSFETRWSHEDLFHELEKTWNQDYSLWKLQLVYWIWQFMLNSIKTSPALWKLLQGNPSETAKFQNNSNAKETNAFLKKQAFIEAVQTAHCISKNNVWSGTTANKYIILKEQGLSLLKNMFFFVLLYFLKNWEKPVF